MPHSTFTFQGDQFYEYNFEEIYDEDGTLPDETIEEELNFE